MDLADVQIDGFYALTSYKSLDITEFDMSFIGNMNKRENMKFRIETKSKNKKIVKLLINSIEDFTPELVNLKFVDN